MNLIKSTWLSRSLKGAFTLIELLVVIAIIAILAGLLLPTNISLISSPVKFKCISNLKQLQLGGVHVKDDNHVSPAFPLPSSPPGIVGPTGTMMATLRVKVGARLTVTPILFSTRRGFYLRICQARSAFRCPGDDFVGQRATAALVFHERADGSILYEAEGFQSRFARASVRGGNRRHLLEPSSALNAGETGATGDGYLEIDSHGGTFPDAPAGNLGGCCGFSFFDGHSEEHKWLTSALTN